MLTLASFIQALEDPAATLGRLAEQEGVDLRMALAASDVSRSTFNRWKTGDFDPRVGSVRKVAAGIEAIARKAA